jgi:hypothetical protein
VALVMVFIGVVGAGCTGGADDGRSALVPSPSSSVSAEPAGPGPTASCTPPTLRTISAAFAKVVGRSPVWAGGFDDHVVLPLGPEEAGRRPAKIMWAVAPSWRDPITVWVTSRSGERATFTSGAGAGGDHAVLDPDDPQARGGATRPDYLQFRSIVSFPRPGCWFLVAQWRGGSWSEPVTARPA